MDTMKDNYVRFFDTTLRDGEQSPGATLTSSEKLELARVLARMGVDVIEAGFPAASPDDLEGVRRIAVEVGQSARSPGRNRSGERRAGFGQSSYHLRAGPDDQERYRRRLGSDPIRRPPSDPYLFGHLANPYEVQTADGPRGSRR